MRTPQAPWLFPGLKTGRPTHPAHLARRVPQLNVPAARLQQRVGRPRLLVPRVGGAVLRGGFAARPTTCSRCAPHAYALREDYGVQLAPEREEPPVVDLDPDVDKLVGDFEPRFPAGPPSLVACERLVVSGDATFGRDVVVRGTVTVHGPARIGDGRA